MELIVYVVECQLEQAWLMSGCSWCEAAEAHRETEGDSWIQSTPPLSLPRIKPRSWKRLRPPLSSFKKQNTEGNCWQVKLLNCNFPKRQPVAGYTCDGRKYVPAGEGREGKGGEGLQGNLEGLVVVGGVSNTHVEQTSITWMPPGRVWCHKH